MSGILQQGYSFGYVLAACANLGVGGSTESWKTVFWAAGEYPKSKRNVYKLTELSMQPVFLSASVSFAFYSPSPSNLSRPKKQANGR